MKPLGEYDTWAASEHTLEAIFKVIYEMHESKPPKNSRAEKLWEAEMEAIRKWAIAVHNHRIDLNIRKWKETK